MIKDKKIKPIAILLALLSVSAITWAIQARVFKRKVVEPPRAVTVKFLTPVYDKVLFQKFEQLSKRYDTLKQNFTIIGFLSVVDKADTGAKLKNVQYVICKKGNSLYYKLGTAETINEDGLYLYIDNAAKRILLSKQRAITNADGIQNLTRIADKLKSEYYNMSGFVKDNVQTISFINEHHISCKQYTVSYDTISSAIKHIYIRTCDVLEPLNKAREKITELDLVEWDEKALIKNYPSPGDVVKKEGSSWRKARPYQNYKLINL